MIKASLANRTFLFCEHTEKLFFLVHGFFDLDCIHYSSGSQVRNRYCQNSQPSLFIDVPGRYGMGTEKSMFLYTKQEEAGFRLFSQKPAHACSYESKPSQAVQSSLLEAEVKNKKERKRRKRRLI